MPHISRLAVALVAALMAMALALPAMAQRPVDHNAAGVVAAVVHVQDNLNDLQILLDDVQVLSDIEIHVVEVKDSLNNVLRNARFLNNINILNNSLNNLECAVIAVCDSFDQVLSDIRVDHNIVAIDVLSGDLIIYVQPLSA